MRIGLVNEYFPPFAPGGAEWSSRALAVGLAEQHHVRMITPNYGAEDRESIEGVQVRRFPSPVKMEGGQVTVRLRWLANPGFYRRVARAVLAEARVEPFDILHVQAKYSLPGAYWAARRLTIPVLFTMRDTHILCPNGQCLIDFDPVHPQCGRFLFWWRTCRRLYLDRYHHDVSHWRLNAALLWQQSQVRLLRMAVRRVDGVIAVSEGIMRVLQQGGLILGKQARVIYNLPPPLAARQPGASPAIREKYRLGEGPVVLYAGKYSAGKGTGVLLQAAERVERNLPQVQFLFAGHGDLAVKGASVRDLGHLPHEELLALYRLSDLVVIPSTWPEPFSRVGLEAMAAGKPLVGTHVGGTPEQIEDGVTGYVVPRKDPEALATAIVKLLTEEELRREMGRAARERVHTKFSTEASLEATIDFYESLMAAHRAEGSGG